MAKHYDNIEDIKSKLVGTIIYHNDIPVICKNTFIYEDDPNTFGLHITNSLTGRNMTSVKLTDPALNWTRFNIGYYNFNHGAIWWYRKPQRQYRQGLRNEQMQYIASERVPDMGFGWQLDKNLDRMLKNDYPNLDMCEKVLKDGEVSVAAFHKDFAMSWDKIHKDMVIEYKGRLIGCMTPNMKDLKLSEDYEHMLEPLKEVIGVR